MIKDFDDESEVTKDKSGLPDCKDSDRQEAYITNGLHSSNVSISRETPIRYLKSEIGQDID